MFVVILDDTRICKWGILGCANIARKNCRSIQMSPNSRICALVSSLSFLTLSPCPVLSCPVSCHTYYTADLSPLLQLLLLLLLLDLLPLSLLFLLFPVLLTLLQLLYTATTIANSAVLIATDSISDVRCVSTPQLPHSFFHNYHHSYHYLGLCIILQTQHFMLGFTTNCQGRSIP